MPAAAALVAAFLLGACEDDPLGPPEGAAVFEVEVSGETFLAVVTDTAEIRRFEERMESGEEGVVSGELRAGNGGFNAPWSWHLDPATVHAPDQSIELCDGRPSMVEGDLEYWLDTVGRFCPWGARVVARTQ